MQIWLIIIKNITQDVWAKTCLLAHVISPYNSEGLYLGISFLLKESAWDESICFLARASVDNSSASALIKSQHRGARKINNSKKIFAVWLYIQWGAAKCLIIDLRACCESTRNTARYIPPPPHLNNEGSTLGFTIKNQCFPITSFYLVQYLSFMIVRPLTSSTLNCIPSPTHKSCSKKGHRIYVFN
jgi:hypothetical protein